MSTYRHDTKIIHIRGYSKPRENIYIYIYIIFEKQGKQIFNKINDTSLIIDQKLLRTHAFQKYLLATFFFC